MRLDDRAWSCHVTCEQQESLGGGIAMKVTLTMDGPGLHVPMPAATKGNKIPVDHRVMRWLVRTLEHIGMLLYQSSPPPSARRRTPEHMYWRLHGWPY